MSFNYFRLVPTPTIMGIVVSAAVAALPTVDADLEKPKINRDESEDKRKLSRYHPSVYSPGKKGLKVS